MPTMPSLIPPSMQAEMQAKEHARAESDSGLRQSAPYEQAAALLAEIERVETEIELVKKKLKEQLKELKRDPVLKTDAGKLAVHDQLMAERRRMLGSVGSVRFTGG